MALVNEAEAKVGDAIAEVARRKWRVQPDWAAADSPVCCSSGTYRRGGTGALARDSSQEIFLLWRSRRPPWK